MLISTIGISITRHYCGEVLSEVYLSSAEKTCCEKKAPVDCCHSESDQISISDAFKIQSVINYELKTNLPVIADLSLIESVISIELSSYSQLTPFSDTSPPLPEDFQVAFQVFLI